MTYKDKIKEKETKRTWREAHKFKFCICCNFEYYNHSFTDHLHTKKYIKNNNKFFI